MMIPDDMRAIQAEGVSMCDARPDLQCFRLRLEKALNCEYTQIGLCRAATPERLRPPSTSSAVSRAYDGYSSHGQ